jgi:hypothetical protein
MPTSAVIKKARTLYYIADRIKESMALQNDTLAGGGQTGGTSGAGSHGGHTR